MRSTPHVVVVGNPADGFSVFLDADGQPFPDGMSAVEAAERADFDNPWHVMIALKVDPVEPAQPQQYGVLIADTNIVMPSETDEHGSGDDAEVRGPFATREAAEEYAMRTARYVCNVVPLTQPVEDH